VPQKNSTGFLSVLTLNHVTMNAIEIKNLTKIYKGTKKSAPKHALKGIDLAIPQGSMFALLGPNGAGKSTCINIMAGLVVKTAGEVAINGYNIETHPRSAKKSIGIVPQEIIFDPFFSPRTVLELQAGLYGIPKTKRKTMEILDMLGLADKADAYARSLSGGMRRRLMVAKAMVHDPDILVLDEPTAGVDIELRRQLWDNVKLLNKEGKTILLTTHYLEEAESMCDRIAIINHGDVIANESKDDLLARIEGKEITFRLDNPIDQVPNSLNGFTARIEGERRIVITYRPSDTQVGQMIEGIKAAGLTITDITTDQSDLEDVFLQLTKD
jgi:ABC-2 type transport system ATP-binding protein